MAEDRMLSDEILLALIKKNSGGGGGTTNYNLLENKPQIAGTELQGDKSLADLGIASASDLAAKQNALTAGDYIDITNDEISVDREIPSVIAEYEIKTEPMVDGQAFISITKTVNGEVVLTQKYGSSTAGINQGINFDDNIYVDYSKTASWSWTYKLRNASVDHAADYTQSWNYGSTVDYTEEFYVTDHRGDKLVIKSELDTALETKQDTLTFDNVPTENSTNPVKSGGVYSALAGKQDALSAGSHIEISNNEVSVNRYAQPAGDIVYRAVTVNATTAYVDKYTSGGTFIERINITVNTYQTQDVESKIRFYREFDGWVITLLANSKEHNAGYSYSARSSGVASQNDFTFTISQTLDDGDLIIRSELATKADTDMVAADFDAATSYTAGNYCVQDGKLYKFKNNHSGAWSAADVDEVKITGELSSLKSGLNDLDYTYVAITDGLFSGGDTEIATITLNAGEVLDGNIEINVRDGGTFNLKARISIDSNTDHINFPTVTCNTRYDFISLPFKYQSRGGEITVHVYINTDNAVHLAFGGYYYRKFKAQ